jgi:hypothetical protein
MFKYIFCFMERTHDQLHLDVPSSVHLKTLGVQVLFESSSSSTEILNMAVV